MVRAFCQPVLKPRQAAVGVFVFHQDHIRAAVPVYVDDGGPAEFAKAWREGVRLPEQLPENAPAVGAENQ
jgi:hypothetical protein